MPSDNSVTLVGNVTRDPELRFTNTGQANVTFGLAVNRRWQNRQTQEWEEATSFFDVVCWREMAENVSESITRGARVMVAGRLEQRSWETQEGDRRSKVEVVADDLVGQAEHAVQGGHGLGFGGEFHHDVVPLALVVHLVGQGALAPAVDGAGGAARGADDLEGLVQHALNQRGFCGGLKDGHDFVGPHERRTSLWTGTSPGP